MSKSREIDQSIQSTNHVTLLRNDFSDDHHFLIIFSPLNSQKSDKQDTRSRYCGKCKYHYFDFNVVGDFEYFELCPLLIEIKQTGVNSYDWGKKTLENKKGKGKITPPISAERAIPQANLDGTRLRPNSQLQHQARTLRSRPTDLIQRLGLDFWRVV